LVIEELRFEHWSAIRSLYVLSSIPRQGVGNRKAIWLPGRPRKIEGFTRIAVNRAIARPFSR
jgi:hypothetical protein